MNILGSVAFSVTASLVYKWKKSFLGAILALTSAAFVVTGVMMLANLVVTPYFMGVDVATVRGMIPKLLLPFNLLKAIVNVGVGVYNLCIGIGLNSWVNVLCAGASAAVTVLLGVGIHKLNEKKKQLERDAQLFE